MLLLDIKTLFPMGGESLSADRKLQCCCFYRVWPVVSQDLPNIWEAVLLKVLTSKVQKHFGCSSAIELLRGNGKLWAMLISPETKYLGCLLKSPGRRDGKAVSFTGVSEYPPGISKAWIKDARQAKNVLEGKEETKAYRKERRNIQVLCLLPWSCN